VPKEFQFLFLGGIGSLQSAWANLPFERISLERSCYGSCPAYKVTLIKATLTGKGQETYQDRFGRAELQATSLGREDQYARRFPQEEGEFTGWIDIWTFGRLSYLIERSGFSSMENHYPIGQAISDASSATLTVSGRGNSKSVSVTAGLGPVELWAIQEAIDSAAKSINWKRK
jgi:hypothetical protein